MNVQLRKKTENLLKHYQNPLIRALIQLIPYAGGSIDTHMMGIVERIKVERKRAFFDELSRGEVELNEKLIESEDFLHCFFVSWEAGVKARRREKTSLFARLLKSAFTENHPRNVDEFEEFASILDDLSFEEWRVLTILDSYSSTPRNSDQNNLIWSRTFWDDFREVVEKEMGIPQDEFTPFMNRLARTGLYDQIVGTYFDYEGGVGMLTARYHRLKIFVSSCNET